MIYRFKSDFLFCKTCKRLAMITSSMIMMQLFGGNLFAQSPTIIAQQSTISNSLTSHKSLKIGDKLSLETISTSEIKNYPKQNLNLSDFGNKKLIILDFWSKYCSACISAMPKMQELQKLFNDQIQIILVTYNTKQELSKLMVTSQNLISNTLPMIFSDSILSKKMFPHNGQPYHVWIDGNGKVLNMSSDDQTDSTKIANYLQNKIITGYSNEFNSLSFYPKGLFEIPQSTILTVEDESFKNNIIYFNNISEKENAIQPMSISVKYSTIGSIMKKGISPYYSTFLSNMPIFRNGQIKNILDNSNKIIGQVYLQYDPTTLIVMAYDSLFKKSDIKITFIIWVKIAMNILKTLPITHGIQRTITLHMKP